MKGNYGSTDFVSNGEMDSTQETPWLTEVSLEDMFAVLPWRCIAWGLSWVVEIGDLTVQPTMANTLSWFYRVPSLGD